MCGRALIAEVGTDMSVFENVHRLVAWAGVCPGNNESAGKKKGGRARRGNVHLKSALVSAAVSSANAKNTYLRDKYARLRARRGKLRAQVAIAHKILLATFHIIRDGVTYRDLGAAYLDSIDRNRTAENLVRRLERLGYDVALNTRESQETASVFS